MLGYICPSDGSELQLVEPCKLQCPKCDFEMESDAPFESVATSEESK